MSFEKLITFPFLHLIANYLKNDPLCYCNNYSNDLVELILINKSIYQYFKNYFWNTYPKIINQPVLGLMDVMPGYTHKYLHNKKICSCLFESTVFDDFSRAVRCINNKKAIGNNQNPNFQLNILQKKIDYLKKNKETFKIGNEEYCEENIHFTNNNITNIKSMLNEFGKNIIITNKECCNGTGLILLFKI